MRKIYNLPLQAPQYDFVIIRNIGFFLQIKKIVVI